MKKIFVRIGVCLASTLVICCILIVFSTFGFGKKASLSNNDTMLAAISSVNTQESSATESQTSDPSVLSSQEDSSVTASGDLPDDLEAYVDNDATATDEYDSFAISKLASQDDYVNVRKEPNTESEVVGRMYSGSVAQVLSYTGEGENLWIEMTSGSVTGYIKAEYFIYGKEAAAVIDNYTSKIAVINASRLYVRSGPGTDQEPIGYLDCGEKAPVLEQTEGWIRIQYASTSEAYISADYVSIIEDYTTAKSMAEIEAQMKLTEELQERSDVDEEATPEDTQVTQPQTPAANNSASDNTSSNTSNNTSSENTNSGSSSASSNSGSSSGTDSNEGLRKQVVEYAKQYVGYPYISGGQSLDTGTDCSGLTMYVYLHFGYYISRTPSGQLESSGYSVSRDQIKPGDIICYETYTPGVCSHVGMYIGDGLIVHASNPTKGVIISSMDIHPILGIKRIIP